jgi:hypothetical protein
MGRAAFHKKAVPAPSLLLEQKKSDKSIARKPPALSQVSLVGLMRPPIALFH